MASRSRRSLPLWPNRERWLGYPKITEAEAAREITVRLTRQEWHGLLQVAGAGYGNDPSHLGSEAIMAIESALGYR